MATEQTKNGELVERPSFFTSDLWGSFQEPKPKIIGAESGFGDNLDGGEAQPSVG